MANRFLNSAGAAPLTPFETSASAATTLTSLLTGATVANDEIIWIKSDSVTVESTTAALTLTSEGAASYGHPLQVISTDDWDDSPTSMSGGAAITVTGFNLYLVGAWRFSGITFNAQAITTAYGSAGPHYQVFDGCEFQTNGTSYMTLGPAQSSNNDNVYCQYNDCTFRTASNNRNMQILQGTHKFNNLHIDTSIITPTVIFSSVTSGFALIEVDNSDFSNAALIGLLYPFSSFSGILTFTNCKFHPNTVALYNLPFQAPGGELFIINCDSGNTHTRHERYGYEGTWKVAATIYATTNPALMDGTVNYSIQMSSADTVGRNMPLYSQWMQVWNDGTAYTPSVEVLTLGLTALNSDELWLEVDYTSGTDSPMGTRAITCPDIITAGAAVASGTTTWVGSGSDTPQKLTSASITPTKPGYIYMRVALAKPSASVYVNPPR
jgi:hypothetical protein